MKNCYFQLFIKSITLRKLLFFSFCHLSSKQELFSNSQELGKKGNYFFEEHSMKVSFRGDCFKTGSPKILVIQLSTTESREWTIRYQKKYLERNGILFKGQVDVCLWWVCLDLCNHFLTTYYTERKKERVSLLGMYWLSARPFSCYHI